jgi:acyl carrier protein
MGNREVPIGGGEPGPWSRTERVVLEVWRDVLRCDGIALDDDFFDLGGDSLLAVRVLARIEELLGYRMALLELFDFPTAGECVARVERGLAELVGADVHH